MADAKRVLFRKGTTAEHKTFAGARAEITVDIDRNIAIVHDGSTQGGHELVGVAATGQSIVNKNSIGIGTSNATSELTVFGSSLITGISTFNSDVIFNGNIGIGTTNPQTSLTVGGIISFAKDSSGVLSTNTRIGDSTTGQNLNTSVNGNIFIGPGAGKSTVNGSHNTFIGRESAFKNVFGGSNNIIGWQAGYNNTASNNQFIGRLSGYFNTTGDQNTFLGHASGYSNITGRWNTHIGAFTGISTAASNKVILGSGFSFDYLFDSPDTTKDIQFAVGIRTDANPSKYWIVGDENFNVGIGSTNPLVALDVAGVIREELHSPAMPVGLNDDIGVNWSKIEMGAGPDFIPALVYCGNGIVLAGSGPNSGDGDIYRSTDFGLTWTKIEMGAGLEFIYSLVYCGNGIVLAGSGIDPGDGDIYRSTDFGLTWTKIEMGAGINGISALVYCGNGIVLASSASTAGGGDINISTDFGLTWTQIEMGAGINSISSLVYCGNGIVLAGSGFNTGNGDIHRSTDFGLTWTKIEMGAAIETIISLVYCGNGIALAGSGSDDGDGDIYRSTDFGLTWTKIEMGGIDLRYISSLVYCGNGIVLAGGSGGSGSGDIYRSDVGFSQAISLQGVYHEHLTGNIGIGSTQPTSKFTVEGDARISGITTTETLSVGIITGIGNSTISVSTSIIPTSNIEYDLGSPTNRFRDLYLSGNTINLGEATLSASGSSIELTSQGGFSVPSLSVSGISSFSNINSTGIVTASTFIGNLTGTATNSVNIGISTLSSTNPAASIVLVANREVGNQSPFIDAGLLYDADANNLYSTSFTGNLFGNASSASIATTATNVNITASNTLGSFCNVVFVNASSGGSGVLVDSANLYYVPSTDTLYSANFRGNLTGTATTSTTLSGVSSGSFLRSDAADQKTSGTLTFNDNVILSLGTGNDCEFFHDGTNNYIDLNVGNLIVRDNTTTRFTFERTTGNLTATGNISDSKGNLRSAPVNNRTSAYTLVAADAGKMITTNSEVTVPASVFSAGDMITIINSGTSSITITQGASTTVYLAVAGNTGNRTLAAKGICTLLCYASNTFLISGAGVN